MECSTAHSLCVVGILIAVLARASTFLTCSFSTLGNGAGTICGAFIKNAWGSDGAVGSARGRRQLGDGEPRDTLADAECDGSIAHLRGDTKQRDAF